MRSWRRFIISRGERGQIVIPALFFFPTLFLFVFLLFETAKLSRAKIRKQFAVDAAAFVEMTNYSDFLNRSAYVNGPFPMRIMREGFRETQQSCRFRTPCDGDKGSDELMWKDGAFPWDNRYKDDANGIPDSEKQWQIEYNPSSGRDVNSENPSMQSWDANPDNPCRGECGIVFAHKTAINYNIGWEDATTIFKMYVQIYQLLGSVESAQLSVLRRLTKESNHNFLSKSYWLNADQTNEALAEGKDGVSSFIAAGADDFVSSSNIRLFCLPKMRIYGNALTHDLGVYGIKWEDFTLPKTIGDCSNADGLFQLVTVKNSSLQGMRASVSGSMGSRGWPVTVKYTVPSNYFGVDLNGEMARADNGPRVHASVSMFMGSGGAGREAAVWPHPQPKFQTRLYP